MRPYVKHCVSKGKTHGELETFKPRCDYEDRQAHTFFSKETENLT